MTPEPRDERNPSGSEPQSPARRSLSFGAECPVDARSRKWLRATSSLDRSGISCHAARAKPIPGKSILTLLRQTYDVRRHRADENCEHLVSDLRQLPSACTITDDDATHMDVARSRHPVTLGVGTDAAAYLGDRKAVVVKSSYRTQQALLIAGSRRDHAAL